MGAYLISFWRSAALRAGLRQRGRSLFYPDPALALRLGPCLSGRTGLLSAVPGGTGWSLVLTVSSGTKEFVSPPTGLAVFP
jgi:hypothetical protein